MSDYRIKVLAQGRLAVSNESGSRYFHDAPCPLRLHKDLLKPLHFLTRAAPPAATFWTPSLRCGPVTFNDVSLSGFVDVYVPLLLTNGIEDDGQAGLRCWSHVNAGLQPCRGYSTKQNNIW